MGIFFTIVLIAIGIYLMFKYLNKDDYSSYSSSQSNTYRPVVNIVVKEDGKIVDHKTKTPTGDADEWIEEFKNLTKTEARKKYFELHDAGIYLPDKAYVYLMKKRNGEVFFTDEEYKERESQGKQTAYVYDLDIYAEQAVSLWSNPHLEYNDKIDQFNQLSKQYKVKKKTENFFEIYKRLTDALIANNLSAENIDFIKSEKRRLSTAITKGNATYKNIPFNNVDKLFKGLTTEFVDFTVKGTSKTETKKEKPSH
jgi:hypothetical protein